MEFKMKLTDEQKAILNGRDGEVMAKVMETVVMYGDIFGAESWCPSRMQTAIWSRASGFLS